MDTFNARNKKRSKQRRLAPFVSKALARLVEFRIGHIDHKGLSIEKRTVGTLRKLNETYDMHQDEDTLFARTVFAMFCAARILRSFK